MLHLRHTTTDNDCYIETDGKLPSLHYAVDSRAPKPAPRFPNITGSRVIWTLGFVDDGSRIHAMGDFDTGVPLGRHTLFSDFKCPSRLEESNSFVYFNRMGELTDSNYPYPIGTPSHTGPAFHISARYSSGMLHGELFIKPHGASIMWQVSARYINGHLEGPVLNVRSHPSDEHMSLLFVANIERVGGDAMHYRLRMGHHSVPREYALGVLHDIAADHERYHELLQDPNIYQASYDVRGLLQLVLPRGFGRTVWFQAM